MNDFDLQIPPITVQNDIVAILSAYDDLIENNTRRIKILGELAQAIYREWFVEFRAPGVQLRKATPEEQKVTGKDVYPVGWKAKNLGEVCNITMGQSPKSEFYNEEGKGLPFHQGVSDFGERFPTDRVFCTVLNRLAEPGDILFSVRAPVGRLNIATGKIVIGRGLSAIRSKNGGHEFIFQQLKETFNKEDMIGGGTIFKSVTGDDMRTIPIMTPDNAQVSQFAALASPIFREIELLSSKNTNLKRTRDSLLPKLITGAIVISVKINAEGIK